MDELVGVLGGGQLGRMLGLAGLPLGLRFRFLDPAVDAPAHMVGDHLRAEFDDQDALFDFAQGLALATYEFESVPVAAVHQLAQRVPVYPPPKALAVAQDRWDEKRLFQQLGIPTPAVMPVQTDAEAQLAGEKMGFPCVLKTRRMGYDGKGQWIVRDPQQLLATWRAMRLPSTVEAFVAFEREVSILAVRGRVGTTCFYPLVENHHRHGMLQWSLAPADDPGGRLTAAAADYAARILDALEYVGVLAIEFFVQNGELLANEMAPRVHNSGHWTIEGAETSQFENHLRAIMGYPLGGTQPLGDCAMVNLIGCNPSISTLLNLPHVHIHWYGKTPRPGRKVGHVTLCRLDRYARDRQLAVLRNIIDGF